MQPTDNPRLQLSVEGEAFSVAPGSNIEITFTLTNTSSAHEQVRITIDGIPLVWIRIEQSTVFLAPGEKREMSMEIQAPAAPNVNAGIYMVILRAASLLNPGPASELPLRLTVAAYEAKGRISVLMDATNFSVNPGEVLRIPLVLINHGLTPDALRPVAANLPEGWVTPPTESTRLEPEESGMASLFIKPPRQPETRPGRVPFEIKVDSQAAPDQVTTIQCTLTVAVFSQFSTDIEPTEGETGNPLQVLVTNLGNAQETFTLVLASTDDKLVFEDVKESTPNEKKDQPEITETETLQSKIEEPLKMPNGKSGSWGFTARQARRPLFGSPTSYPYTAKVTSSNQETQELNARVIGKALLPMWVLVVILVLAASLLFVALFRLLSNREGSSGLVTPIATSTRSDLDQRPFLVDRNWYLVAFNNNPSVPGAQEPYTRFNQDGTLIGHTGCKNFSGIYTTDFNVINVTALTATPDDCGDPALIPQEQAMLDILRSAQSYFVADTALQVVSPRGFLNHSLTPANRPEENVPPEAVIGGPIQAMVNEIVTFDGRSSSGQSPILLWEWDFGDGGRGNGSIAQHVYANPGRYRVRMTVTDQGGLQDSQTHEIDILALPTATLSPTNTPAPTATPLPTDQPTPEPRPTDTPPPTPTEKPVVEPPRANIAAPREGFLGEPVKIDASQSLPGSSPITSYSWIFGNGSQAGPSSEAQVSFIYEQSGVFEATVLVTDQNGLSSSATTTIRIDARLDTIVWTLDSISDQPLVPGTAITLQFLEGRIEGFSGCNTYSGDYTATDNGDGTYSVTLTRLRSGRVACPKAIMEQETRYLQMIEQVNLASIQGNVLALGSPQGRLVYHEVGTPKPDLR